MMNQPPPPPAPLADGWFDVGDAAQLLPVLDARHAVCVDTRHLALIRTRTGIHAIDATCYHMGGPLLRGVVEDIEDVEAILCPYHHYHIALATGERVYRDLHGQTQTIGGKQRVHEAKETRDGRVHVRLCLDGEFESDRYADKAPPPCALGRAGAYKPGPRSGEVFNRAGAAAAGRVGRSGDSREIGPGAVDSLVKSMVVQSMRGGDGAAPWAVSRNVGGSSAFATPSVRQVRRKHVSFGAQEGDEDGDGADDDAMG